MTTDRQDECPQCGVYLDGHVPCPMTVWCPQCYAEPGDKCVYPSGDALRIGSHARRVRAVGRGCGDQKATTEYAWRIACADGVNRHGAYDYDSHNAALAAMALETSTAQTCGPHTLERMTITRTPWSPVDRKEGDE